MIYLFETSQINLKLYDITKTRLSVTKTLGSKFTSNFKYLLSFTDITDDKGIEQSCMRSSSQILDCSLDDSCCVGLKLDLITSKYENVYLKVYMYNTNPVLKLDEILIT